MFIARHSCAVVALTLGPALLLLAVLLGLQFSGQVVVFEVAFFGGDNDYYDVRTMRADALKEATQEAASPISGVAMAARSISSQLFKRKRSTTTTSGLLPSIH